MSDFTIGKTKYRFGDDFVLDGKKYIQSYEPDSLGSGPYRPPGMRISYHGQKGWVLHQRMHWDCGEEYYGNVIVRLDNGTFISTNGWMTKEVQGSCLISIFHVKGREDETQCMLGTWGCSDRVHQMELDVSEIQEEGEFDVI